MQKNYLLEKWLDALRSGDYKQGQYQLYNDLNDTYCCLGVLCDVAGLRKSKDSYENSGFVEDELFLGANIYESSLPEKLNLPEELVLPIETIKNLKDQDVIQTLINYYRIENTVSISLIELNDDEAFSFNTIADIIELYYSL